MGLIGTESPGDAVSGVNPDFVGQKRQCLPTFALALGARRRVPGLRTYCLRTKKRGTEQQRQPREFSWHIDLSVLVTNGHCRCNGPISADPTPLCVLRAFLRESQFWCHPTPSCAETRSTELGGLAVIEPEQAAEALTTFDRTCSNHRCLGRDAFVAQTPGAAVLHDNDP